MLMKQFKTIEEQKEADKLFNEFDTKGNKHINVDNFIKLDYSYCSFVLDGRYHKGFYSRNNIKALMKILEYYQGKIRTLNG